MENNNFKLSTAEFKGKVTAQLDDIHDDLLTIREFIESNSTRISTIEIWQANFMGKITLAIGIVSLAFTCFWEFIKERISKQ